MAGKSAILTVKILSDASNATKGIDDASSRYDNFGSTMGKVTAASALALAGIAVFAKGAIDSASRTEQAMGALDSVFGANASVVKGWAANAAQSVGLAKSEYGELASVIGAQLNNLGLDSQAALTGTQDLITLGADLAATFGGTTADAVGALSAALRGEADPAERFGLALNQTAVNAYLASKGLSGLTGDALRTAKTQAILEMATQQAGGALGQFGREADTVAGQQQRAAAEWENAKSTLGEGLLPIVTQVTSALGGFASILGQNAGLVTGVVAGVAALAGVVVAVSTAIKVWAAIQALWNAAVVIAANVQLAWNLATLAFPGLWLVLVIVAVIAIIVLLWTKCEGFRTVVIAIWNAIASAAVAAWNIVKTAVSAVISWASSAITGFGSTASSVWNAVSSAATSAWNGIRSVVASVVGAITSSLSTVASVGTSIWGGISGAASAAFNTLRSVATSALDAILAPFRAIQAVINTVIGAVQNLISALSRIKVPEINLPFGLGSFSASLSAPATASALAVAGPAAYRATPSLGAGLIRAAAGGGGSTVINVTGGLDSADTIARRVEGLLTARQRRTGAVTIARRTA